jgi:chemotaxis protein MotB
VARKKKPAEHVNHERWLVSYADFITLLFAFFTTLYAISTVDAQKMGKMVTSMRASFDSSMFPPGADRIMVMPGSSSSAASPTSATSKEASQRIRTAKENNGRAAVMQALKDMKSNFGAKGDAGKNLGSLKQNIESLVGKSALGSKVETRMDRRGLIITLGEGGFFDSGSDQLKPEGRVLLDAIATGLAATDNHIRVEGHTDNVPIRNSRFPSNWELSTARATTIIAYLVPKFGFTPSMLSAAGYGEYRPIATNDTDEGRARNRRIDIVVLNPQLAQLEP